MQLIVLDGKDCTSKEKAHQLLKEKLNLPDYYGQNLDALWDCLSSDFTEKMIMIRHPEWIVKNLGTYGSALLRLFEDLKQENDHIHVIYSYTLNK